MIKSKHTIAILLLISGCTNAFSADSNWESLFNGKDLGQFELRTHSADAKKRYFYVENGTIVANATEADHNYMWLYSKKTYLNFHLRLKYQVERGDYANSGIQLRSFYDEKGGAWKNGTGGWLNGPQVDIGSRGTDGSIYNEVEPGIYRQWLKQVDSSGHFIWSDEGDGWNEMEIQFVGSDLKVWLNGEAVMDYSGKDLWDNGFHRDRGVGSMPGHIALQIHANDIMKIKFKDIQILDLGPPKHAQSNWQSLFNGINFANWSIMGASDDMKETFWSVDEGCILAESTHEKHGKVYLYSDKQYENFHLRLKYQVEREHFANSGVVFRGKYDPVLNGGHLHGPQVDISTKKGAGNLYDETEGVRKWYVAEMFSHLTIWSDQGTGWNELDIVVDDLNVKVWFNKELVTDFDGRGIFDTPFHQTHQVGSVAGHLALQLHSWDIMKIRYKDIEIVDLDQQRHSN